MHIFPPQLEIEDDEGFSKEKDIFELEKFGKGLMNLNERVEDPMVIALDGPWGSGKTTFIKMWLGLLRNNGFPVIYFDAFANDHLDDAFTAIAGEFVSLADAQGAQGQGTFKQKAIDVGKVLLRSGAKIGIKALTLGALSRNDLEDLKSIPGDMAQEASELTDNYLKAQLENHVKERSILEDFRSALKDISKNLSNSMDADNTQEEGEQTPPNRPLVFVVDELDRCKPPFALALLEKIKHLFSVEGVNFVLVTNLDQLKNSVKYDYGNDDDEARLYLHKFYNLVIRLPERDTNGRNYLNKFLRHIFSHFPEDNEGNNYKDKVIDQLVAVCSIRQYSLRVVEKIATHVAIVLGTTGENHLRNAPLVTGLCVFKVMEADLYERAKNKTLDMDAVDEFFKFSRWKETTGKSHESAKDAWEYCLVKDKGLEPSTPYFSKHNIYQAEKVLPTLCEQVIDSMNFSK